MSILTAVLSLLFLIPFFGWGIYTLRVRFHDHEELPLKTEFVTLSAVALFVAIELYLTRFWMANQPVLYVFTVLGIVVAATALYGPLLVSFASQILVDVLMTDNQPRNEGPQFGPMDALERMGDYDGAIEECMVLARLYPKDATVALRIAGNFANMDRYNEAAEWFERGLARIHDSERALRISNRLSEIYARRLQQPEDARRVLERFAETYPDHDRSDSVRLRIEKMSDHPNEELSSVPGLSSE